MNKAFRCPTFPSPNRVGSRSPANRAGSRSRSPANRKGRSLFRRLSVNAGVRGKVWEILNKYFPKGSSVNKDEIWSTVKQLRGLGKFVHGVLIMEWLENKSIKYSDMDHSIKLDLVSKTKGIAEAESYMNALKPRDKNNKLVYGSLLNCYSSSGMESNALLLLSEMTRLGLVTSALPFTSLMSMYLKMGKHEEVVSLEAEMKRRNIFMSTHSYNLLMQSHAAVNDIEGVERIMRQIELVDSHLIDWETYSNLATIYVKAGLLEKAKGVLKKLEAKMKPKSLENFHFLISLYAGVGELNEVIRVWRSLKYVVRGFNNVSYMIMIQALGKLGDFRGLKMCFEEWKNGYSHEDMRVVVAVISAYLHHHKYDKAILVYEESLKKFKGPFFNMRERFIYYFLENNFTDLALNYLDDNVSEAMNNKQLSVKSELVSAFLSYFEKVKDVSGAEDVIEIIKPVYRPKTSDYLSLLKVYVAAGEVTTEMRLRLRREGIKRTNPELEDILQRIRPSYSNDPRVTEFAPKD